MKAPQKNFLEWFTFGIGGALVLSTVGFLAIDAWRSEDTPPHLEIALGKPVARHGHFAVPVTATNLGTRSAEQVEIEVILKEADGSDERATLQLAFVPRNSERRGWVSFVGDPSLGKLTARPLGYEAP